MTLTAHLGKYLGVPLLHKRAVNSTYAPLVDKMTKNLSGWKSKVLNMDGKSVFIESSVLSIIPLYQMQRVLIPKGILRKIEKISRDFLWSKGDEDTRIHLIAWGRIKRD